MKDEGSLALGSKKFQDETKRHAYKEKLQKLITRLIDPGTNLLKEELGIKRNCPLCNEPPENTRVVFVKEGFHYLKCRGCTLIYVSPMLKEDSIQEMYEASDYAQGWMQVLLNPVEQKFNRPKFEHGLQRIEQIKKQKGGRILDIGCAVGQFLQIARDLNWEVMGVELNKTAREYCQKSGFEVSGELLTDCSFPADSFDAVSMWDVFEHIPHPRQILRSVNKMLKPEGVLLILVPNVDSLAARVMQEKCNMFLGMSHLNMFNNATLTRLLKEEALTVVESTTIISEVSVINNYLDYEHPYVGESDLLNTLFDKINPDYILDNYLGYKLLVYAQK